MKPLSFILLTIFVIFTTPHTYAQWETINGVTTERLFATYTINSQEALIGGKDGVLFKTNDGGNTWTTISTTNEDIDDICFMDDNTGFLVAGSSIFKTTNGGNSWSLIAVTTVGDLVGISFPTAQTGYACSENGEVLKSSDGGASWQEINTVSGQDISAIDFGDDQTGVIVGGSGTVFQTADGGTTWQETSPGVAQDLNDVCFTSAANVYLVGDEGILMHSPNGGTDWANQVSLTVSNLNAICFHDEQNGYAAGRDGVIVYTDNAGNLWNSVTPITTERLLAIHFSDAGHGYAVGREGIILRYSVATGFQDVDDEKARVLVCPNPVQDEGIIKIKNHHNLPWQVEIIDLSGSHVKTYENITSNEMCLETDAFKSGMYIYTVKVADQQTLTGKFVIQ